MEHIPSRFGFEDLTGVDINPTDNMNTIQGRNAMLNTFILQQQSTDIEHNTKSQQLEMMSILGQRLEQPDLPDFGPMGRYNSITPHVEHMDVEREFVTVHRPSLYEFKEEQRRNQTKLSRRSAHQDIPANSSFELLHGDDIYSTPKVSTRQNRSEPTLVNAEAASSRDTPCSIVVSAYPSDQQFLVIYGRSDGKEKPTKTYIRGTKRLDGLTPNAYTVVVGSESASDELQIDTRKPMHRLSVTPLAFKCGTRLSTRPENPLYSAPRRHGAPLTKSYKLAQ